MGAGASAEGSPAEQIAAASEDELRGVINDLTPEQKEKIKAAMKKKDAPGRDWSADLPEEGATKEIVKNSGADAKNIPGWIAETLKAHNDYRALHGAPPLEWDPELAEKAQLAADECAKTDTLMHSHCREYGHGQNAFGGTPGGFGAKDAVDAWYEELEKPGYTWDDAGSPDGCPGCGHFTQVVWKDCAKVGMAADSEGKGFIIANYWPPGNMVGNYAAQVFPVGTEMKERVKVRTEPYEGAVQEGQAELEDILATLRSSGQNDVADKIEERIKSGAQVTVEFKPNPDGEFKYKWESDEGSGSGSCTF